MSLVFLALGSNIEPRFSYIEQATELLAKQFPTEFKSSSVYQCNAYCGIEQNDYLNRCVTFEYSGSPFGLLKKTSKIEQRLGRAIKRGKGESRTIDIDILSFGKQVIRHPDLILPHYDLSQRDFFLIPLLELDNTLVNRLSGKSIKDDLLAIPAKLKTSPQRI